MNQTISSNAICAFDTGRAKSGYVSCPCPCPCPCSSFWSFDFFPDLEFEFPGLESGLAKHIEEDDEANNRSGNGQNTRHNFVPRLVI